MQLRRLAIRRFRLLESVELDLGPGVTIIQGRNAQGKTSLLEAIYYLVTGRSFRTRLDAEVVAWGTPPAPAAPPALVEGEVTRRHAAALLRVVIASDAKRIFCDDKPLDRLGRLYGRFNAILFTPADLRLVQGGPALRRRFLDAELAQVDPAYLSALQRYDVALRQRNAVLRRGAVPGRESDLHRLLGAYREELMTAGTLLTHTRARAVAALGAHASRLYADIAGAAESLSLRYRPAIVGTAAPSPGEDDDAPPAPGDPSDGAPPSAETATAPAPLELLDRPTLARLFAERFDARLAHDLRHRQTSVGPHRDDLQFLLGGRDARDFGSQGQQRSCVLALRLAEIAFMREATGEPPVLLLDDIVSELDAGRRAAFFRALPPDVQVVATATDAEPLRALAPGARVITLDGGGVVAAP